MKIFKINICCYFLLFALISNAQAVKFISPQIPPFPEEINKSVLNNRDTNKNPLFPSKTLLSFLDKEDRNQVHNLTHLQNNLNELSLDMKRKIIFKEQITQMIKRQSQNSLLNNFKNDPSMNFLELQLSDALIWLEEMRGAPRRTVQIIMKMRELAIDAASGTRSSKELVILNEEFQSYKVAINHAQMSGLLHGVKRMGTGDIHIQIGEERSEEASLVISVPAFDIKSLGLNDLNVLSMAQAQITIDKLYNAEQTLMKCITILESTPVIDDAEAMLISIPKYLYRNFRFLSQLQEVILATVNGTENDETRELYNIYLNYIKSAMVQSQTYLSLNGSKSLAGGNIIIRIGNELSIENTLKINVPVTDLYKLQISQMDVLSLTNAYAALDSIIKIMRDFAYFPENQELSQ